VDFFSSTIIVDAFTLIIWRINGTDLPQKETPGKVCKSFVFPDNAQAYPTLLPLKSKTD